MKKISQIAGAVAGVALVLGNLACAGSSQMVSAPLMDKLASPAPTVTPTHTDHEDNVPRIKAEEAVKIAQAGNAVIIDTRDKGSYDNLRIKDAINIPYSQFQDGKHPKLPKDKQLIFYCT